MHIDYAACARPSAASLQLLRALARDADPLGVPRLFVNPDLGLAGTVVAPKPSAIDPEIENAPLDAPVIGDAEKLLSDIWPDAAMQMGLLVRQFYPLQRIDGKDHRSEWGCICGHDWPRDMWSIYVTIYAVKGLVEGWVHEMAHCLLHEFGVHLLEWDDRLLLNPQSDLFASPARRDTPRPMGAVLQGTYSYIHVCEWELRCLKAGDSVVKPQLEFNLGRLDQALEVIPPNIRTTADGARFWEACETWIREIMTDAESLGLSVRRTI